jgi:hypothetical protein
VDAVGVPLDDKSYWNRFFYFKFPDRTLNPHVARACHALALDEERKSFTPVLWDERSETSERIKQVWFAGVHSNVGGGYPRQGMSLVALDWMMSRAEDSGLRFIPSDREQYKMHADAGDKMYDPRAGVGMFYRWEPRNIRELCQENCKLKDDGKPAEPKVHRSVINRIARSTEGYAPGSVPPPKNPADLRKVLDAADDTFTGYEEAEKLLTEREAPLLRLGKFAYWLSMAAVATTGWFIAKGFYGDVGHILQSIAGEQWLGLIFPVFKQHWLLAIVLVVSIVGERWVKGRLSQNYSEFWSGQRFDLSKSVELRDSK